MAAPAENIQEAQQLLDNMAAAAENIQEDQQPSDDESWANSHENSLVDDDDDDSDWDLDSDISVDENEQIQDAQGFTRVFPYFSDFVPAAEVTERAQRLQRRTAEAGPVDADAPPIPDELPSIADVRPSDALVYSGKF